MRALPSSLYTIFFLFIFFFFLFHQCVKRLLTRLLACSRDYVCAYRVLRVNAIREIIIAVNVLLETTKQLQSSYISRREEAKQ